MTILYHVIKDPVHGSVQFDTSEDGWVKPFIDSPNFQRLRHIKQLGVADWIFPGAVHTRFSHNVGCGYVASQICNKLGLPDKDKQIVILACLLHDIGHGPFSHAFEELFYKRAIRHENWTPMFLAEFAQKDFLTYFNKRNSKYPLTEKTILIIQKLITNSEHKNKLLADIVSSQLDADRLDYLLRDSHFCGVTYGVYDFRWLLHCLTEIEKDGQKRLGITTKGIGVVEQYLMARRLMIKNVYQHGKKHGGEFLLQAFLKYTAQAVSEDKQFSDLAEHGLITFLQNVNQFNERAKKSQKDLSELKETFVHENYARYKQLCDYDIFALVRDLAGQDKDHTVVRLAKRLHARRLPKVMYINSQSTKQAKRLIAEFKQKYCKKIEDWQITLLQFPHLSYVINHDPILVQDSFNRMSYLHDDSLMIGAISDKRESSSLVSIDAEIIDQPEIVKLREALKDL